MSNTTVTNTSEVPAAKPAYDPIIMLTEYLKSNPNAPSYLSNYLINRLGDQIKWYDKRSGEFKNTWMTFRRWIILLSASIPFLVGLIGMNFGDEPNESFNLFIKLIVGAAGVTIAVLEGLNSLYKSQEFYIDYRITAEQLRQEFCLFLGKGGIYENLSDALSYSKLIVRCESIMASENNKWAEIARQNEKSAESIEIQKALEEFLKKYKIESFVTPKPEKPKVDKGGTNPKPE